MAKLNSVSFLFNLQKRIDLARKDWPSSMTFSFLPTKAIFKSLGYESSSFSFIKVTDIINRIQKDPISEKEAFASELTSMLDQIILSLESLSVKILSGKDESDLKSKRNFTDLIIDSQEASGPHFDGLPLPHVLFDFTTFLVININKNKVILGITVDGSNNVSSAYFIVQ